MPSLPIFILGAVILAWGLAAVSLLARRRSRGAGSRGAWRALPLLSEDDVARRIGAGGVRPTAMAGPGVVTTRLAASPARGRVEPDREPAGMRRWRLWRDAAAVLLVSSLAVLAVTAVDPNPFPSGARRGSNLLAAAAAGTPAAPATTASAGPPTATAPGSAPAPTLVLTADATPGPVPTPAGVAPAGPLDARDDVVTVLAAVPARIDVLANDGGGPGRPLVITAVTQGARGRVTTDGTNVGYDPTACSLGTDAFTYTVTDGRSSATRSVLVTISGPGRDGFPATPVTDAPQARFIPGSTVGSTIPMRLSWCGVVATTLGGYTVDRSSDGGASWSSAVDPMTSLTSSVRELVVGVGYAWRVRTTDGAGRVSGYAVSPVSRLARIEDTATTLVRYAGLWQAAMSTGYSGGTERYASSPAATATVVVTGARAFAIVSSEVGTRGSFRLFVDGVQVAIVSERAPSVRFRRVVYERELAPGVRHTIMIRPVGDGRVDLDAILALE